jgi:hypothetical protein
MSKLILFDFTCDACGITEEKMVTSNVFEYKCSYCLEKQGGMMTRVISGTNFKLDGTDPAFPTAYDRWGKQHEKAGGQDYDDQS